ncbi:hypothetical protein HJD18_12530 [Thermoleophilia bacterium SCSIO 60948]|nr:hypothetical protein HJD18_12530 [Thermoleophilia bacterium SCSIO 60948]
MSKPQHDTLISFGTKVLGLLDEASFSTTYKFGLLLALIDRAREGTGPDGRAPDRLSVATVAARMLEIYWPQTARFPGRSGPVLLRQSGNKKAVIVSRLSEIRAVGGYSPTASIHSVKQSPDYPRLLDDVEWTAAQMPLPRLQRPYAPFLYEIDWDETTTRTSYRQSSREIRFLRGASDHLVRLAPLLRPQIEGRWAQMVAGLNRNYLDSSRLESFLFDQQRRPPRKLVRGLSLLQNRRCFYCAGSITTNDVDHFLPYAHSLDDGIENLVVACKRCNSAKSAHRAAALHVERWAERLERRGEDLVGLALQQSWEHDRGRTTGLARATYLALPQDALLWRGPGNFEAMRGSRGAIERSLAHA